ncbi:MAG: hypothetical protein AAB895_03940 [Patescibacteria group bacterium]
MIIKPNIENRVIRKLLWEQKNIPFILATAALMFIIGFLSYSLAGQSSFKIGAVNYLLVAFALNFLFVKFYKNLAKKIPQEDIEKKRQEIMNSLSYKATSGNVRFVRTIIISLVSFAVILGVVILVSIYSTN